MTENKVVEVQHLSKKYGSLQAVRDVSFSIAEKSIFGLLGPNGAGKTSIIEMIEGIRTPDSGTISVAGLDPVRQGRQVREIIGAQLQNTSLHDKITLSELLDLFASFYKAPKKVKDVLDLVGMLGKEHVFLQTLSGGEKQRVALALALIGDPKVVFLDEPTTGLDAEIRLQLHKLILRIRDEGKVVMMTTHYIEEAEKLCDMVGVLQHGTLKAVAPPQELIRMNRADERVKVVFQQKTDPSMLKLLKGVTEVNAENGRFVLSGPDAGKIAASVTSYSEREGNTIEELKIFHATLEDVYLNMMGSEETK
jgi:ABC-2 type transport system ATP-binding protein